MAAVTVDNWLVLPRVAEPALDMVERPVEQVAEAERLTDHASPCAWWIRSCDTNGGGGLIQDGDIQ